METKNFGFLLFQDVEELDVVGPWEMITMWSKEYQGPQNIFTVSQYGGLIKCSKGLKIQSDYSFENCPKLNYLLVPGGRGTRQEVNNPELINFIRHQFPTLEYILSVCTGAFLLQAAGLLSGKKAATHWLGLSQLRSFPEISVIEERYVCNEKIWCAAGVSAGIDLALALIATIAGEETAGKVQLHTEYYPENKRYGDLTSIVGLPHYLKK